MTDFQRPAHGANLFKAFNLVAAAGQRPLQNEANCFIVFNINSIHFF